MKYFIKTYGCQMNIADSLWLEKIFAALGYERAEDLDEADVFLINSCSVRQATEDKVYGLAPKVLAAREVRPGLKVVLTGCLVGSAVGERPRLKLAGLKKRLLWVDFFVPPEGIFRELPRILTSDGASCERVAKAVGEPGAVVFTEDDVRQAYVTIMRGCNQFCSYCVVPYARGAEISRPLEEIVTEVKSLIDQGATKITLLGQNVNSYGRDFTATSHSESRNKFGTGFISESSAPSGRGILNQVQDDGLNTPGSGGHPFAVLLRRLHDLAGLEKIWFITSNPWNFSDDLIDALALPKIEKYLHLPVQSGDDIILKKMNRPYTAAEYLDLVRRIRARVPGMKFGTDIIVGFPGETAAQFQKTADLVKAVGFIGAFIALYSPREGTAAAKLYRDDVPKEEKRRRHAILTAIVEGERAAKKEG